MSIREVQILNSDTESDSDCDSPLSPITNLNFNFKINLQPAKMATPVLKREYLDMVPDFTGIPELLPRFLEISEKLVTKFYNATDPNDFQNEYLMSSILAKVKGDAASNISSCKINNWLDLKKSLIDCYADKRDVFTLNLELSEQKQEASENPFDYYNRLQKLLNLILSYLMTHLPADQREILSQFFRSYTLRILLKGLREPIGSLMRTKNPQDLSSALNMLTNDFQINMSNASQSSSKNTSNKTNHQKIKPQFNNFNRQYQTFQNQQPIFQNFQRPLALTNSPFNQPNNNFRQTTPQNFNNPNFQNKRSFSKVTATRPPIQNKLFNKPTPMSISTRNTNPQYGNFRPSGPQNFISEELFNVNDDKSCEFTFDEQNYDEPNSSVSNPVDVTELETPEVQFPEDDDSFLD